MNNMYNNWQDLYDIAAFRMAPRNITEGKVKIKEAVKQALPTIRLVKFLSLSIFVFCFLVFCLGFGDYVSKSATRIPLKTSEVWLDSVALFFLPLSIVGANFGQFAQYVSPFREWFALPAACHPTELADLFDELKNGPLKARTRQGRLPTYLFDSEWRILLVAGADFREARRGLCWAFRQKFSGDVEVKNEEPLRDHVVIDGEPSGSVALGTLITQAAYTPPSSHPALWLSDQNQLPNASTEQVAQSSGPSQAHPQDSERVQFIISRLRRVPAHNFESLFSFILQTNEARRKNGRRKWKEGQSRKWKIVIEAAHAFSLRLPTDRSTDETLLSACVDALISAKRSGKITCTGLRGEIDTEDWVYGFIYNEAAYGWIHGAVEKFNSAFVP